MEGREREASAETIKMQMKGIKTQRIDRIDGEVE